MSKSVYSLSLGKWIECDVLEEQAPARKEHKPQKKRKKFQARFVRLPPKWMDALRGAGGNVYHLAWAVLAEDFKIRQSKFFRELKLSQKVTGLPSASRHRARDEAVNRGLFDVKQTGRGAYIVTKIYRTPRP